MIEDSEFRKEIPESDYPRKMQEYEKIPRIRRRRK